MVYTKNVTASVTKLGKSNMIKSFRHKGLKQLFENGETKGINTNHAEKASRILLNIDKAKEIRELNKPAYGLLPLKGKMKDLWAVDVSGNYRITFKFENGDAYILDYQDYH